MCVTGNASPLTPTLFFWRGVVSEGVPATWLTLCAGKDDFGSGLVLLSAMIFRWASASTQNAERHRLSLVTIVPTGDLIFFAR